MVKKVLIAIFLTSAVAFAPVAAWAQNPPAESVPEENAPTKAHHGHHHHPTTTIKGEFSDSADGGVFVRRRFLACINQADCVKTRMPSRAIQFSRNFGPF